MENFIVCERKTNDDARDIVTEYCLDRRINYKLPDVIISTIISEVFQKIKYSYFDLIYFSLRYIRAVNNQVITRYGLIPHLPISCLLFHDNLSLGSEACW